MHVPSLVKVGCLIALLSAVPGRAAFPAPATTNAASVATNAVPAKSLPVLWFPVGEELVYRIKWGVVSVGSSRITSEWVVRDGRVLLAIRYRTRTNRVFNKIYPMNDVGESIIDPETFLPVTFSFRKQRWRTACDDVVTFDYDQGVARIESRCKGWRKDVAINREVRDIMGFMYWMRREPLTPGMDRTFRVMGNDGIVTLRLRTADKPEILDLPVFGKTECLRVDPEVNLEDLLVEEGSLTLWVADDARRMAPRLAVKAPLANVHTILSRVLGPGDDKWVTLSRDKSNPPDPDVDE